MLAMEEFIKLITIEKRELKDQVAELLADPQSKAAKVSEEPQQRSELAE